MFPSIEDAIAMGAVSALIAYVKQSQPQLTLAEQKIEVERMLRVVGWREDAISEWVQSDFFADD